MFDVFAPRSSSPPQPPGELDNIRHWESGIFYRLSVVGVVSPRLSVGLVEKEIAIMRARYVVYAIYDLQTV